MKTTSIPDKNGMGNWIIILGCPLYEKHILHDPRGEYSGPSFALCVSCEHQIGKNYQMMGAEGYYDGADVFPERLICGIGKGRRSED